MSSSGRSHLDAGTTPWTQAGAVDADGAPAGRSRLGGGRSTVLMVSGLVTVALAALIALIPVPYVVLWPGPVYDTLGERDGEPLISIEGTQTYPTEGRLDVTTVYFGPKAGSHMQLGRVLAGWLDPGVSVLPREVYFPPETTPEDVEERSQALMVSSKESATAAALRSLDIEVPVTLAVAGFAGQAPSEQVLQAGDVLRSVDGQQLTGADQLRDLLQEHEPGDTVDVVVARGGDELALQVRTTGEEGGPTLLGVLLDPTFDFPFEVSYASGDVGGDSAGLMFTLGVIDLLTPGAITGGEHIAGTGTISPGGDVGPIGSIQHKLVGAREVGARWFLAPAANCEQVAGAVPDGLTVVAVSTLDEALDAVEAIATGEGTDDLPSCGAGTA